ncbi:Aldehyde dehydrogenase family 3 member [Trichinella spiralis]|uniref:Aldehyde dehydrogenase family 3 member n=1 Tax=Trichinella spiralis TaxID=6334 RepID=A0ABR3KBK7_TRISP
MRYRGNAKMPVLINIPIKASTSASVAASCGVKYLPKYSIRQRTGDASISDSKRLYGITPMQDNESPESSDTWYKRLNSSSESVSGSDTSGSGRTTICLTVCPDFVCRKTVSKSMSNRSSVVYSQGKSQQSTSNAKTGLRNLRLWMSDAKLNKFLATKYFLSCTSFHAFGIGVFWELANFGIGIGHSRYGIKDAECGLQIRRHVCYLLHATS